MDLSELFLVPAEGADRDVHAEQLPDAKTLAELQEHLGPDRTLQLSMIVDPSAAASFGADRRTATNNGSKYVSYISKLGQPGGKKQ